MPKFEGKTVLFPSSRKQFLRNVEWEKKLSCIKKMWHYTCHGANQAR